MKKLTVSLDLAKAHIDSFTRKDGAFVQAHDDKRQAAPHEKVKDHAMAAGAKFRSNVSAFTKPDLAHSFAEKTHASKGGAFVMTHPDHDHHVVVGGADAQRMEKNGYQHAKPGATPKPSAPAPAKPSGSPYAAARKEVMMSVPKDRHPAAKKMLDDMEAGGDHDEEFGKYHFGAAHETVRKTLQKHGVGVKNAAPKLMVKKPLA